eukprot:g78997.t1
MPFFCPNQIIFYTGRSDYFTEALTKGVFNRIHFISASRRSSLDQSKAKTTAAAAVSLATAAATSSSSLDSSAEASPPSKPSGEISGFLEQQYNLDSTPAKRRSSFSYHDLTDSFRLGADSSSPDHQPDAPITAYSTPSASPTGSPRSFPSHSPVSDSRSVTNLSRPLFFRTEGRYLKGYKDSFCSDTMLVERIDMGQVLSITATHASTSASEQGACLPLLSLVLPAPTSQKGSESDQPEQKGNRSDQQLIIRLAPRGELELETWLEALEARRRYWAYVAQHEPKGKEEKIAGKEKIEGKEEEEKDVSRSIQQAEPWVPPAEGVWPQHESLSAVLAYYANDISRLDKECGAKETGLSDLQIYRFLAANRYDYASAKQQLTNTVAFRRLHNAAAIDARIKEMKLGKEPMKTALARFPHYNVAGVAIPTIPIHKITKGGVPVNISQYGRWNTTNINGKITEREFFEFNVYTWEFISSILEEESIKQGKVVRAIQIADAADMGYALLRSLPYLQPAIEANQQHYPEMYSHVLVIRAPWIFPTVWSVMKSFLAPGFQARVQTVPAENQRSMLHEIIGKADVPQRLGGDCCCPDGCMH